MKLALLASLSLSLAASSARADCAFSGLFARPITAANTALPPDGGIVIAALFDQRGRLDPGDPALAHTFKIKSGAKLTTRSLAPGLAVVAVPRATGELLDDAGTSVLAWKAGAKAAPPAAPVVTKIVYSGQQLRHGSEHVFVGIDNLPADALAIVIADAKGTPRSFALVGPAKPDQPGGYGYLSSDCQALPNGTVASRPGDKVTVMVVDAYGRISPRSKPMVVTGTKP